MPEKYTGEKSGALEKKYKKTTLVKVVLFLLFSTSYFLDFDLEEEVFLLEEAVFLEEEEELQQDLVAFEP